MGSFRYLDTLSLDDLLEEAQHQPGGQAMNEIVRRFEPLARKIARSMSASPMVQDDVANEARLALFLGVQRHELGRPGFARYAELTMRGAALRWHQAWIKRVGTDLEHVDEPVATEPPALGWGDAAVAEVVRSLPDRQQQLLRARYIDDAELAAIARAEGTSESAVSQRLRTANRVVAAMLAA